MAVRHIINSDGVYVVQDSGDEAMPELPSGANEVDPSPSPFHTRVNDAWVEDTDQKIQALSAENRAIRDRMLKLDVDPIVTNPLRWADLTTEKQNEWTQYRNNLLNVPQQAGFPNTVNWPTKPE